MRKRLASFWNSYKFRFVPWIILNLKEKKGPSPGSAHPRPETRGQHQNMSKLEQGSHHRHGDRHLNQNHHHHTPPPSSLSNKGADNHGPMIVHHVQKGEDKLVTDEELLPVMVNLFSEFLESERKYKKAKDVSKRNLEIMEKLLGYSLERRKSLVSKDAGTGVFLASGYAKPGSLIALYPGTLYMPSEPLFFPSIGNPFIFRCSDGLHIDGNDKWISKSIFKSCAARDKFRLDLPCCDTSWLTATPMNPLNMGQYVNNRSKSSVNNVVYQESSITLGLASDMGANKTFPVHLCRFLPNVWSNPGNNHQPLRLVPLVSVKGIGEGEEILSSYFTMVHSKKEGKVP